MPVIEVVQRIAVPDLPDIELSYDDGDLVWLSSVRSTEEDSTWS